MRIQSFRIDLALFVGATVGLFVGAAARLAYAEDATVPNENYVDARVAENCFSDDNVAALAVAGARGDLERVDHLVALGVNPNLRAKTA